MLQQFGHDTTLSLDQLCDFYFQLVNLNFPKQLSMVFHNTKYIPDKLFLVVHKKFQVFYLKKFIKCNLKFLALFNKLTHKLLTINIMIN